MVSECRDSGVGMNGRERVCVFGVHITASD